MAKKKPMGRPHAEYETLQIRLDNETVMALKKIAGYKGQTTTRAMREWLLPLAKAELSRLVMADMADMAKDVRGKPDAKS